MYMYVGMQVYTLAVVYAYEKHKVDIEYALLILILLSTAIYTSQSIRTHIAL